MMIKTKNELSLIQSILLVTVLLFPTALVEATKELRVSPWDPEETPVNFVPFPPEVEPRLLNEIDRYKKNPSIPPVVRVFQSFPEPLDGNYHNKEKRIWPQLKSINQRLHPILWPHVQYNVLDGLDFGCRKVDPDNGEGPTLPITTSHCHRHCLHQGRYCLDEPDLHSNHRRAALKEITRRLCMDTIYHAKDPRFISYLQHYDELECYGNPETETLPDHGFRNCSLTAMSLAGMKYSDLSKCVAEDKFDQDIPNEAMNRNLRKLAKTARKFNYSMPFIMMNDYEKLPDKALQSTGTIFQQYCSHYPSLLEQPLACHACKHCDNIRECLWTLQCNGQDFDPHHINPEVWNLEGPYGPVILPPKHNTSVTQMVDYGADVHDNTTDSNEEENEGEGGFIFGLILGLLIVLVGSSAYYYYRQFRKERAQKTLRDIANGKYSSSDGTFGIYKDNPNEEEQQYKDIPLGGRIGDDVDETTNSRRLSDSERLRSRAMDLLSMVDNGISVRYLKKSMQQEREEQRKKGNLDDSLEGSNGKGFSDDVDDELHKMAAYKDNNNSSEPTRKEDNIKDDDEIVVEDLGEDEEEWVEFRRGKGMAMAAANSILC